MVGRPITGLDSPTLADVVDRANDPVDYVDRCFGDLLSSTHALPFSAARNDSRAASPNARALSSSDALAGTRVDLV
jgi:hypothetical protein